MSLARAVVGKIGRRLAAVDQRPARPARKQGGSPTRHRARSESAPRSSYPTLPGDRLLVRPVFILASVRSGSTMLRLMLGSHSQIHAPHELHLVSVKVDVRGRFANQAMAALGMDTVQLEHLLWDRIMHRELVRHGKKIVVNKTPTSVFLWRRLLDCWPDARFVYLLRHPGATAASWTRAHPDWPADRIERDLLRYMVAIENARSQQEGLTVRYEDITRFPEQEVKRLCDFIGVEPEPAMIEYGESGHGSFGRGIGDWSERLQSGRVQPPLPVPAPSEIPARLLDIAKQWGYLSDPG